MSRQNRPKLREIKRLLFEEGGGCCYWCGCSCRNKHTLKPQAFTVDHVIPRSRGGGDDRSNLVPACLKCNQARNVIETKLLAGKNIPPRLQIDRLFPVKEFKKYPESGQVAP